jgi:hypothetical protein
MAAMFKQEGVRFLYPENWGLTKEETSDGWSVTVQAAEGGAFLLLSVHDGRPAVQEVLDTTLAALKEDYPELEATPIEERIAGHKAKGLDVQFLSLDFVTNCWVRSWRTATHTVLLMSQASDLDGLQAESVLRAMQASLETI